MPSCFNAEDKVSAISQDHKNTTNTEQSYGVQDISFALTNIGKPFELVKIPSYET